MKHYFVDPRDFTVTCENEKRGYFSGRYKYFTKEITARRYAVKLMKQRIKELHQEIFEENKRIGELRKEQTA